MDLVCCDVCMRPHGSEADLEHWSGASLCVDCYDIPEIKDARWNRWEVVIWTLVQQHRVKCSLCNIPVIDKDTAEALLNFELHPTKVNSRQASVGAMIRTGKSLSKVLQEVDVQRVLCCPCKSVLEATAAEIDQVWIDPNIANHELVMSQIIDDIAYDGIVLHQLACSDATDPKQIN